MAIIGRVEKKNWKVKVLNLAIHLVLILGATTMVYPLLLMISGSLKSSVDFKDFDIVPQYFYQDTALFKKYINTKYNTKDYLTILCNWRSYIIGCHKECT